MRNGQRSFTAPSRNQVPPCEDPRLMNSTARAAAPKAPITTSELPLEKPWLVTCATLSVDTFNGPTVPLAKSVSCAIRAPGRENVISVPERVVMPVKLSNEALGSKRWWWVE